MIRLIYTQGGSNKFWEAETKGSDLVIRFGKIATKGQEQIKTFLSAAAAQKELEKREKEKRASGYVDDGGNARAPLEAEAPAPKKSAKPKYPFLYYGRRPADWFEGSNLGYRFDVRFTAALDRATAKKAERVFRSALEESKAVELAPRAWAFAGEWANFAVGDRYGEWVEENGDEIGLYDELWDDLAAAFEAVHAEFPLAEVVNRNVRDYGDTDDWSSWSMSQKPDPGSWPADEKSVDIEPKPSPKPIADPAKALDDAERASKRGDHELALRTLPALEASTQSRALDVLLAMFRRWGHLQDSNPFKDALVRTPVKDADAVLIERLRAWSSSSDLDDTIAAPHLMDVIAARRPKAAIAPLLAIARDSSDELLQRCAREALAAYSDEAAVAELRAYFAEQANEPSMELEHVVEALVVRGDPATTFELLSPHVVAHRKSPRKAGELAERTMFSLSTRAKKGDAIDPRWCAIAFSVLDGPGELVHYAPDVVAKAPAKERADLILSRAERHELAPSMLEALASEPRAESVLDRHLAMSKKTVVVLAAARALLARDASHRPKVVEAIGRALIDSDGEWGVERLAPFAITLGKAMADGLQKAIADWSARKPKGAASKREQNNVLKLLKSARASLA